MSSGPLNNMLLMAGGIDTGIVLANSVRLNDDDSAYMSWTPATSKRKGWTLSFWLKRGNLGTAQSILSAGADSSNHTVLRFTAANKLQFTHLDATVADCDYVSTQLFRDPSAWYHFVINYDAAQGTAADRVTITVNGVEVTTWDTETDPTLNKDVDWTWTGQAAEIGRSGAGDEYFDGYLAQFHFAAKNLAATNFGRFNVEGHWVPAEYTGGVGSSGFHLDFAVAPGTGNGAGTDVSGNDAHFTDSGLAANDQRADTPTANHCTWNLLDTGGPVYTNGLLEATYNATELARANWYLASGKWYWEVDCLTAVAAAEVYIGVATALASKTGALGADAYGWALNHPSGTVLDWDTGGSSTTFTDTGTLVTDKYVMVAYDADSGKLWFGIDGSWLDSGNPATGANPVATLTDLVCPAASGSTNEVLQLRTESGDFETAAPTGFRALSVANLSDANDAPIPKGSDYFDVLAYTGAGANDVVTGLDFSPDMVWIKNRAAVYEHQVYDTLRGTDNSLAPHVGDAEDTTNANGLLDSFDAGGFTLADGATDNFNTHDTSDTYVAWCWKEAVKAGFDIAGYTGTGTAKTVAHSLGVSPDFIIVKNRQSAANNWHTYAASALSSTSVPIADPETDRRFLDTNAIADDSALSWNDTAPDASNFTVGTASGVNESAKNIIAYLWANIPGFSRQGSYVGNGTPDGPFVWCGFRPRFVLIKRDTTALNDWQISDTTRNPVNDDNTFGLFPNNTAAESQTNNEIDFLANGFKLRAPDARTNASAGEYIFMAFAEHPFKYARAF